MTEKKYFVKGSDKPVVKIYETFNGDLYFFIDKEMCYARLYSMPQFAEWGINSIKYLTEAYGRMKIWEVKPENWDNINSYEDGLLKIEEV